MRGPTDNPIDPLGTLGAPIRPVAPAPAPNPAKGFELGNWSATLPKGLAEKPAEPPAAEPLEGIVFMNMPAADWDRYHDLLRVHHQAREAIDDLLGIPKVFGRPA